MQCRITESPFVSGFTEQRYRTSIHTFWQRNNGLGLQFLFNVCHCCLMGCASAPRTDVPINKQLTVMESVSCCRKDPCVIELMQPLPYDASADAINCAAEAYCSQACIVNIIFETFQLVTLRSALIFSSFQRLLDN